MRKLNLTGKDGSTYNLEEIASSNGRNSSNEKLVVQVWEWNPKGLKKFEGTPEFEDHKKSNPPNLKVGQIWLSKYVSEE